MSSSVKVHGATGSLTHVTLMKWRQWTFSVGAVAAPGAATEGGGGGHTVEGVPAVARAHGLAHGDAGGLHVLAEELDVLVLVGMDAAGVAAPTRLVSSTRIR